MKPALALPLERTVYFVGETVPLAVWSAAAGKVELVDERGAVAAVGDGPGTAWRIPTASLAPGTYQVRRNGEIVPAFSLVSPLRPSPGVLFDEVPPGVPWQEANDPVKVAAWQAKFDQAFHESGINALATVGTDFNKSYPNQDLYARYQTMLYVNPYDRQWSFVGARVYAPEMEALAHKMALLSQANLRFPTFGGFIYNWDPVGFDRSMLYIYWQHKDPAGLKSYIKGSYQAIVDQFTQRTGLTPPSTQEFIRYCVATGHPEFAPAIDLPTAKWIAAIAEKAPPMPATEQAAIAKRLDAWTRYLTGVLGEANAYHSQWLRRIEPSLRNTSSHDNEFSTHDGSWQPAAYAPLDFRFIEAWNDQIDGPDYGYQWLFHAALVDIGRRPGQPVWVGSSLGWAHDMAKYPGRFSRAVAHNLAYGGRGIGFALEGFSNLMGGMNDQTRWWNLRGTAGAEDVRLGREWLQRFAPLEEQARPVRRAGVLLSLSQYGVQAGGYGFDTPPFNAFLTLARLGYMPRFVTEDDLAAQDGLAGFGALAIVNQTAPLPAPATAGLQAFIARGGKVLVSSNSTVQIPNATTLGVAEPFHRPGRPFNWGSANSPDSHASLLLEQRLDEQAPAYLAALGDALRTLLVPAGNEASRISTFSLDGGSDAAYVVAANDSFYANQSTWARQDVKLTPNGASAYTALYDLSDEKALGAVAPVTAAFQDRTARLYALLTRPVATLDLRATQEVPAGTAVNLSVAFRDEKGKALSAAIPFQVQWSDPKGIVNQAYYRATSREGTFEMSVPLGCNVPVGTWTLGIRCLLDGRTASLPVVVQTGKPAAIAAVNEPVLTRGDVAGFWKEKPTLVAPIFDGPERAASLAAAQAARETLASLGVTVKIQDNPVVGTYFVHYAPTEDETAANSRAERGEAIGKIDTKVFESGFASSMGGYVFGLPVLLFDLAGQTNNPMADQLDSVGMLWPRVTAEFPGAGRAVIQRVKSPFKLGVDAIVVQAADVAGLTAGARALAQPPTDWLSDGIRRARLDLQAGYSIGRTPAEAVEADTRPGGKLTAKNLTVGNAPQPLALAMPGEKPPTRAEAHFPAPPSRVVTNLSGTIEVSKGALPYYQADGRWVRAWNPGGAWIGDLRFSEATFVKVRVPAAGTYRVALNGVFRYSDRRPKSQATWEELLDLYMKTVKPQRQPMTFEVLVDGKAAGTLKEIKAEEREVATQSSTPDPRQGLVKEEVVVQVSGPLTFPAGEHEILFVHRNIVDGKLETVAVGQ